MTTRVASQARRRDVSADTCTPSSRTDWPAAPGIEVTDQIEQVRGGGVEMGGQLGDSSVGLRRLYTAIFEASRRRQRRRLVADPQFFGEPLSSRASVSPSAAQVGSRRTPGTRDQSSPPTLSSRIRAHYLKMDRIGYTCATPRRRGRGRPVSVALARALVYDAFPEGATAWPRT